MLKAKAKREGDEEKKKKKKGSSYVDVYGMEKAMEVAEDLRGKAKRELSAFDKYGDGVVPLYSFVDFAADRSFTIDSSV